MFQPVLHARIKEQSGRVRALTVFDRAPLGVLAVAGLLRDDRLDKPVGELGSDDHDAADVIGLASLDHVYGYFSAPEYAALIRQLRAAGDNPDASANVANPAFASDVVGPAFADENPRLFGSR